MRRPGSFALQVYRYGTVLLEPAAAALLLWRRRQGKEDGDRLSERRGIPGAERPDGHLAWVHGASIGEALAILPLVERLTQRGMTVLVTTGTRTSALTIARRLPPGAIHQFVPLDVPRYLSRFLAHWRPDIALFVESEIWPNAILSLEAADIPLILVNGRLSERSFRRWTKAPQLARALFSRFSLCLAQTRLDGERMQILGAPHINVVGNLKFDSPPPPADPAVVTAMQGLVSGRPIWVAASTHPGEEEIAVAVHRALVGRHPRLLTIVVPRHPSRGGDVRDIAVESGLRTGRRAEGAQPDRQTEFYVADTVGELGLFYRLAQLVYMGGSLIPHGGQNPIEAAKLGSAVLHGPHVHNFAEVYAAVDDAGGALRIDDARALAASLDDLFADPALTRDMARAGAETVARLSGALERTVRAIEPFVLGLKLERR